MSDLNNNSISLLTRELNKKLNKKKKDQTKLKVEDQANYVDSSRNLAVELDSKDLRMALKNFKREVVEIEIFLKMIELH